MFWGDVEPSDGNFVWTTLDSLASQAAAARKFAVIRVMPGWAAPAWLYGGSSCMELYEADIENPLLSGLVGVINHLMQCQLGNAAAVALEQALSEN